MFFLVTVVCNSRGNTAAVFWAQRSCRGSSLKGPAIFRFPILKYGLLKLRKGFSQ